MAVEDKKRKVFSVDFKETDYNRLEVIGKYFEVKKGLDYKKGAIVKALISEKYAEIVALADASGKSLDDYLSGK